MQDPNSDFNGHIFFRAQVPAYRHNVSLIPHMAGLLVAQQLTPFISFVDR